MSNNHPGNDGTPLVSVLMAAYNAELTIQEAVDSVLSQTYPNLELVVVNEGSTDNTASILAEYGDDIRVVDQANSGLAAARNAGCKAAHGEFIALMDADDRCSPDRIAVQMAAVQKFGDVALCSTEFSAFDTTGPISKGYSRHYYSTLGRASGGLKSLLPQFDQLKTVRGVFPIYLGKIYEKVVFGNFLHPPTLLFPVTTLLLCGFFDESLRSHSDWEWIVRASKIGRVAYVDFSFLDYRISPTQRSAAGQREERTVDLINVVTRIWQRDQVLAASTTQQRRTQMGQICLDAADAVCDKDKIASAKYLGKGVLAGRRVGLNALKVFVKIIFPRPLIQLLRYLRGRNSHGDLIQK